MNMYKYSYILRDAREGIQRNWGAAAAAAALVFVSMVIAGILFLLRSGAGDLLGYLEAQVSMKVYVEPGYDTGAIARILQDKSYVKSVEIETREQQLARLAFFFEGREHLLAAFKESQLPDAVRVELSDKSQMDVVASGLDAVTGIAKVVYPQQFAETMMHWSNVLNRYGLVLLLFLAVLAFGMVFVAIHLSLYQRQQEIRVKLLIGANPAHVRVQFLFEGWLIGLLGSLLAALVVYLLFVSMLLPLKQQFPLVFSFSSGTVYQTMAGVIGAGSVVGLLASYLSTRKWIGDA